MYAGSGYLFSFILFCIFHTFWACINSFLISKKINNTKKSEYIKKTSHRSLKSLSVFNNEQVSNRGPSTYGSLCEEQTNEFKDSPEFSSFTREDMVLVIESAATSKSFLKFLLEP